MTRNEAAVTTGKIKVGSAAVKSVNLDGKGEESAHNGHELCDTQARRQRVEILTTWCPL